MKEEVSLHLEKARRKLKASERLLTLREYEDSLSRSYYAMFHASRAALLTEDSNPKTHEGVIKEFGRLLVKTNKVPSGLREALVAAKAFREKADYVPSFEGTEKIAKQVHKSAKEFLSQIEKYLRRIRR